MTNLDLMSSNFFVSNKNGVMINTQKKGPPLEKKKKRIKKEEKKIEKKNTPYSLLTPNKYGGGYDKCILVSNYIFPKWTLKICKLFS